MTALTHAEAMGIALDEARVGIAEGEIPIGAVVLDHDGSVLGRAHNMREGAHDPTAHAEVLALRQAAASRGSWRLEGCTIVVTMEPCPMCAGAIVMSRIPRLVFGAWNEEYGAAGSRWDLVRDRRLNHRAEVIPGIRAEECAEVVTEFLAAHRPRGGEG